MSRWRRWLRLLLACLALFVTYFAIPVSTRSTAMAIVIQLCFTVVGVGVLAWTISTHVRRQIAEGVARPLDNLVLLLTAVLVVFAFTFYMLERHAPEQFAGLATRIDALYFTMATLTTVGFGDVHATGQAARALVVVQMIFNVIFVAAAGAIVSARLKTVAASRVQGWPGKPR